MHAMRRGHTTSPSGDASQTRRAHASLQVVCLCEAGKAALSCHFRFVAFGLWVAQPWFSLLVCCLENDWMECDV